MLHKHLDHRTPSPPDLPRSTVALLAVSMAVATLLALVALQADVKAATGAALAIGWFVNRWLGKGAGLQVAFGLLLRCDRPPVGSSRSAAILASRSDPDDFFPTVTFRGTARPASECVRADVRAP